ncbi:MAG: glycosyl hydrolase [Planctomycetota bacterium]
MATRCTLLSVPLFALSSLFAILPATHAQMATELERSFQKPPASARPWVYWFWLNGNITKEGITADLEAVQRAGIGGVLIMEVDQGAPLGPIDFMSDAWRELFKHVVSEAQRLGLEVNMNNDAGWNGSGGPWIKPEQSMQKVVWTEAQVEGPKRLEIDLAQPEVVAGYYRDIAVLAFPTPGPYRIEGIRVKAGYEIGPGAVPLVTEEVAREMVIDRERVADITALMERTGRLTWDVPQGKWTILRFGHTSTGVENAPAPKSGRGLECDKLSKQGIEANFAGMMGKLIADVGPATGKGKTLVATHIDSWENGAQNWTARMREEFGKRRGYDLLPFLPALTGRVVGGLEITERFLWDLRQTISDLIVENYAGHMRALAAQHGISLSIEAYTAPCNELAYAGRADEPMGEFWMGAGAWETLKEMASAVHTYGKPILGAEAFTAGDRERWLQHPGSIKSLGDRAFSEGVNRFVFHRYAMQPWLDRVPGMTMGPWGLHYERTNTWWDWTLPWHEYLSRCQFMLCQGHFVADICYLLPEAAPQGGSGRAKRGYDYDDCNAEVVLTRMSVKDGRLVLPDGIRYRLLVLPEIPVMTPALLARVKALIEAGATVVGPKTIKSPSLSNFPDCDAEVERLADEIWGDCDGRAVTEHKLGAGRILWGVTPEQVLASAGVQPDFSGLGLHWIHRSTGDTDVYFVANPLSTRTLSVGTFRVSGKSPELSWPETGRTEVAPAFKEKNGTTSVLLALDPSESVFVVFRKADAKRNPVAALKRDGKMVWSLAEPPPKLVVKSARYGVLDDPQRTRDVRAKVQQLVDAGALGFRVARMAEGDDPAYGIVKTLIVEYSVGSQQLSARGTDPEVIDLAPGAPAERMADLTLDSEGLHLHAWQPGRYELETASGQVCRAEVTGLPSPHEVTGTWDVTFPAGSGAPQRITLQRLISLSEHSEPGVRYFSGVATYTKKLAIPVELLGKDRRLYLDLGNVQVMAEVRVNGQSLGMAWKRPYMVDITSAARPGENSLEVRVANLWINRMLGDEQLPEDSERNENGTLKAWPQWLAEGKPSPTGRFTFTSWRLWKKDEPLPDSGLLGPVTLRPVAVSLLQE